MKRIPQLLVILALILSSSAWSAPGAAGVSGPTPPPGHQVFIPLVGGSQGYAVSGQVKDAKGQPIAGATVTDSSGVSAITDANGNYALSGLSSGSHALAPSKPGVQFSPAVVDLAVNGALSGQNFTGQTACSDVIQNGTFEADASWKITNTPYPARYTTLAAHSGTRSMLGGITPGGVNTYSYSSARQALSIPTGTTSATLTLWVYPESTEPATLALPARPDGPDFGLAPLAYDAQYVLVLDQDAQLLETLLWMRSDNRQWALYQFNLTKYAGRTIFIQVGAFNDGIGGVSALFTDDVALQVCSEGSVPPTPIPPTPSPAGCSNLFTNSNFENNGGWNMPITEYPANYTTAIAHTGVQSMRMGIANTSINKYSYSDAWQAATIVPSNATSASVTMYLYPVSSEVAATKSTAPMAPPANLAEIFGKASLGTDAQYVLLLDQWGNIIKTLLWWQPSNAQVWTPVTFDLTAYRGRYVRIQAGVFNNGGDGVTAMFMDDATLDVCTSGSVVPTPAPTATPGPVPTPIPGTCTEKIANNSFESVANWFIPLTAFSAGYSSTVAHSGVQSMRTGIYAGAHNRFSYSDFYQQVTIPSSFTSATLSIWIYPISNAGAMQQMQTVDLRPTSNLTPDEALSGDVQYLLVLDSFGNWINTLMWQRSNAQAWTNLTFNLAGYAGQTIRLQFGTYNDGANGVTAMYVDDVTLQVCP